MIRYAPKRLYAALLLLILLAAYAGQKVHIYNEDHAHFSAHCGDLVPDNGAHTIIVDRCIIDDFYFFPYLDIAPTVHLCPDAGRAAARGNPLQTLRAGVGHFAACASRGVAPIPGFSSPIGLPGACSPGHTIYILSDKQ